MARTVLEVFLSSTAMDLAPFREAVYERLRRTGLFHCVRQEDFGAQDAGAVAFCRQQIERADFFIGLIGMRRGWEPQGDSGQRSITQMENDWARAAGCRRLIWVAPDDFPVPGHLRESDAADARQRAFRARIMGTGELIVSSRGFGAPDALASDIVERLLTFVISRDLVAGAQGRPSRGGGQAAIEDPAAPIAKAVERLADDQDVDLLALARNPASIDVAGLTSKLKAHADALETKARPLIEDGQRKLAESARYWRHAGALAFLSDTAAALAALDRAVALDPGDPEGWRARGELHFRRGDLKAAEADFDKVLETALARDDKRAQALASMRFGWIYRQRGDLAAAEEFQQEALRLAKATRWSEGEARACGNLGLIYDTAGDHARAEEMHVRSLTLEGMLGSRDGIARASGNLGITLQKLGKRERAVEMQQQSLEIYEQIGDREGAARAVVNLGTLLKEAGDLAAAEAMQRRALEAYEALARKEGVAVARANLGAVLVARGRTEEAEPLLRTALADFDALGSKEGAIDVHRSLARAASTRGDAVDTVEHARRAHALAEALGNASLIQLTRDELAAALAHRVVD